MKEDYVLIVECVNNNFQSTKPIESLIEWLLLWVFKKTLTSITAQTAAIKMW